MITTKQLAEYFEERLNEVFGNPEIQFKIWADAGEHVKSHREGNTVTYFINGNLLTSSSANDANALVMGVNNLYLQFAVPLQQPRTNMKQTAEELQKIKDGQYPFIEKITNVINGYFQRADVFTLQDDKKINFTVAYQAGTVIPDTVDLQAQIEDYLPISVYIEVYFMESGLNSKDVVVLFDNVPVPFLAARHGRTPAIESDVYSGSLVSKSLITSSAFAIDLDFPAATSDALTQSTINYLMSGNPNEAHFVRVAFGGAQQTLYLMMINTVQTSVQGIAIAGFSCSLIEVIENIEALNFPDDYQLSKFKMNDSKAESITFTLSRSCNAFIAGKASIMAGSQTVELSPDDFIYDSQDDCYYVYLVTDREVTITSSVPVIVE